MNDLTRGFMLLGFLQFFFRLCCAAAFVLAAAGSAEAAGSVSGPTPYEDERTPEGWAWARIRQGREADFNVRCATPGRDPNSKSEISWQDDCRHIAGSFVADVLTHESMHGLVQKAGVKIIGARIVGEINLRNARLHNALTLEKSLVQGDINLNAARAEGPISLVRSQLDGRLNAWQFRCDLSLDLRFSEFWGDVILHGAKIDGSVEMDGSVFTKEINASALQVGGDLHMRSTQPDAAKFAAVVLSSARITGNLDIDGAEIAGDLYADSLQVGGSVFMRSTDEYDARFERVILDNAKVTGSVQMDGATIAGEVEAGAMQVGLSLFMRSIARKAAVFNGVTLSSARVLGNVDMDGARFDGDITADSLQVGGSLFMRSSSQHPARFARVNLIGARVGSNVETGGGKFKNVIMRGVSVTRNVVMDGAEFDEAAEASALQVGASLFMESTVHPKGFNLTSARVAGTLSLRKARFGGPLNADFLQVGENLDMQNVISSRRIRMNFAQIAGNLDIRGVTLAQFDLSGATVASDFRLNGPTSPYKNTFWRVEENVAGRLILRNARITNLMDTRDAWPVAGNLDIGGFKFSHLGGFDDDLAMGVSSDSRAKSGSEPEMIGRGMEWWDNWVQLDPGYSPTPYEQLAAALTAVGNRAAADQIRYLGRVQQRSTENWPTWIFSGLLQYTTGFGIGERTFRVLYWVLGISAAGAIYLWRYVPAARKHGAMWCFGASLSRLLPVIEINKEFTDFFHDPERNHLTHGQLFLFSTMGIIGWVLGALLVAAVSGLTQRP